MYYLNRSTRTTILKQLEEMCIKPNEPTKSGSSRKSHILSRPSISSMARNKLGQSDSSLHSSTDVLNTLEHGDVDLYITTEGALATEIGLITLETLEIFGEEFKVQV